MDRQDVITGWLRRFGMIHGYVMVAVYFVCLITGTDRVFDTRFFGDMILFSIAGSLPGFIYISRHELSAREWWIRTAIHYVMLNVLLMPISYSIGLWRTLPGALIIAGAILAIDVCVHLAVFGANWVLARRMNRMLKKKQTNGET